MGRNTLVSEYLADIPGLIACSEHIRTRFRFQLEDHGSLERSVSRPDDSLKPR